MRNLMILLMLLTMTGIADAGIDDGFLKKPGQNDVGTPDGREGGESVADAVVIASVPYLDSGNTSDNIDDYYESCPYVGSDSPDVVYAFTPAVDGSYNLDLCDASFSTVLYVYENTVTPGNPFACNYHYYFCEDQYHSRLPDLALTGGNTYYIVIDGYNGAMGDYTFFFDYSTPPPPPCVLECPPGGVDEGEPPLEDGYYDVYNDGCQGSPNMFQLLEHPILCAVSGWYTTQGSSSRDADWFTCFADQGGFITASAYAELDLYLFLTLPTDCNNVAVVYDALCRCEEPGTLEFAHPAFTECWLWFGPTTFHGPLPSYEFNYILNIDGIEYSQPSAAEFDSWGGIKSKFK